MIFICIHWCKCNLYLWDIEPVQEISRVGAGGDLAQGLKHLPGRCEVEFDPQYQAGKIKERKKKKKRYLV